MSRTKPTQSKQSLPTRDFTIVRDFIKYLLIFFVPFFLLGVIYGLLNKCYFSCMVFNPIIYAGGISSIIVVIMHDVNDIPALFGWVRQPQLALHVKHADTIQKVSYQMSTRDFGGALKTVSRLLKEEPEYANALNLKGQILLEGFGESHKARSCFKKVLKLEKSGSEDYKLAQGLLAETYNE
jgi:tetratricopeptide (TPR) repeat protein